MKRSQIHNDFVLQTYSAHVLRSAAGKIWIFCAYESPVLNVLRSLLTCIPPDYCFRQRSSEFLARFARTWEIMCGRMLTQ